MKDKRGKYRKKEGFTLVELICVIATFLQSPSGAFCKAGSHL